MNKTTFFKNVRSAFFFLFVLLFEFSGLANPATACVTISGENGRGSGFIIHSEGRYYVVTNNHVIQEIINPTIIDISGCKLDVDVVYASVVRDLCFLDVSNSIFREFNGNHDSLMLENNVHTLEYGIPVSCYGDSEGTGVIVKCDGQLNGIGPLELEASCPFVSGNSGSPLINNQTGRVIGVATYIHDLNSSGFAKGTRFSKDDDNIPRRFFTRIDNTNTNEFETLSYYSIAHSRAMVKRLDNQYDFVAQFLGKYTQQEILAHKELFRNTLQDFFNHFDILPIFIGVGNRYWSKKYIHSYNTLMSLIEPFDIAVYYDIKTEENTFSPNLIKEKKKFDYSWIMLCLKEGFISQEDKYLCSLKNNNFYMDLTRWFLIHGTYEQFKCFLNISAPHSNIHNNNESNAPSLILCAIWNTNSDSAPLLNFLLKRIKINDQWDNNKFLFAALNKPIKGLLNDELEVKKMKRDKFETLKILFENGLVYGPTKDYHLKFNTKDRYVSPLMLARSQEVANLLLLHGASIEETDENGRNLLHIAVEEGDIDFVRYSIEKGANIEQRMTQKSSFIRETSTWQCADEDEPNYMGLRGRIGEYKKGSTPLLCAVCSNEPNALEIVKILIENGANAFATDDDGKTVLEKCQKDDVREYIEKIYKYNNKK